MAREIVGWCDECTENDTRTVGVTRKVDLGSGYRELEVCEDHWESITVARLEELADKFGRRHDATDASPTKLRCPWCPRSLANPRNLRDHVDTAHPENAELFLEGLLKKSRGAKVQPKTEEGSGRLKQHPCRYCGKVCTGGQGLAAHERWCEKKPS